MPTLDIPASWEGSAAEILDNNWRKILVLGSADRGKSTYCAFLAHKLRSGHRRIALVDADVGQKDVGPPATITLGYFPSRGQAEIKPCAYYFVGSTSPSGHLLPMVVGARRMLDAAGSGFAIINTTGFVYGAGRVLKTHKIEALRPDVIVALQVGNELESILRAHRNRQILRIASPRRAAVKSADEKKANRKAAFSRYFRKATQVSLPLTKVVFQRSLLFSGEPFTDPDLIYAERTAEGIIAVSVKPAQATVLKTLRPGFERNLLCGVGDEDDDGLGIAIIREINFKRGIVSLLTPVPRNAITVLQLGDIYVTPDGEELGSGSPLRA